MNWTKMSAIAEIVSSIAILATLAYLAIQTQQNTAAIVSTSRQQSLDSELELIRMFVDYPEMSGRQPSGSDFTAGRRLYTSIALFRIREHQWFQVKDDLLDEATFSSYLKMLVNAIQGEETMAILWANAVQQGAYDADFMATVNDELARSSLRAE